MKIKTWGGKRKGAGRPNLSGLSGHTARETVLPRYPLHITLKVKKGIVSLRRFKLERAFKTSVEKAKAKGLRVLEYAIESNHVHMIIEADGASALRSGMASFAGRYGRLIRLATGGSGSVFQGRYHMRVLKSPRQTKNAIRYVLFNHSKHDGRHLHPDDLSSVMSFKDWQDLMGWDLKKPLEPRAYCLSDAKSWLARTGWRKAT